MSDSDTSRPPSGTPSQVTPVAPVAALLPGIVLVFAGLWMVTDGGPLGLGWACFAVGGAFLLVGAVAQGVAWGLALHDDRRP